MNLPATASRSLRALRAFVAERPESTACGLCGAIIPAHPHHEHLWLRKAGRIACACNACALLFASDVAAPYRRLPTEVEQLPPGALEEADWQLLGVPIRLAFFVRRAEPVLECLYPSPAGP